MVITTSSNVEGRVEGQTQMVSDHVFRVFTTKAQRHGDGLASRVSQRQTFNLQPETRAKRVPPAPRTENPERRAERAQ